MNVINDITRIQVGTYAQILKGGGVVAFPTETVYGLGASAVNPAAVLRIFELKGRPADNPLIVHVSTYAMLVEFAAEIPAKSRILMQKFWPGPLTLVFEKRKEVLDMITGGLSSVAIRMPDHEMALALLDASGPLVAPSANVSGRPSPTKAEHVHDDFGNSVPVLDGGDCIVGLESTVLDVRSEPFRILRPGSITAQMIKDKTGLVVVEADIMPSEDMQPLSPGMKYTHYAPDTPIRWMTSEEMSGNIDEAVLYLILNSSGLTKEMKNVIDFKDDMNRLGKELYDWFRRSDKTAYNEVAIQPLDVSEKNDLAKALNNRISKAIKK
ncbi:MAG: threonylcarbamoyl-AMP synthase [Balneolales bacterium]|nr:threonylcarbamoyl-AMP synthase [Balneolales bacterium]